MSEAVYHVRRALVDDLENLRALWGAMCYPTTELERRLTEFQVAEDEDGRLLGALGVEINGRQGVLHSEAFVDFALADDLRARLWTRIQTMGNHHGLTRLWTREPAPFWRQTGFHAAAGDCLKRLPGVWAADPVGWLTLELRDEAALEQTLEKAFVRLKEEHAPAGAALPGRGRMLKLAATAVAILLAGFVAVASIYLLRHFPSGWGH